jgi:hypothetical protein
LTARLREADGVVDRNGEANGDGVAAGGFTLTTAAQEFFRRALAEELSPADVFRITITSFLDAYNFDVRRLMKCCIHHVLPSGHVIPFCAYNVLYRDGHAPLPPLRAAVEQMTSPRAMEQPRQPAFPQETLP